MHLRPLRRIFGSALACLALPAVLSLTGVAHAGPKDREAEKLLKQAMDEDYLATDFAKAEAKLQNAVKICGCSNDLLGRVHIALGTVYGVGLSDGAKAKEQFVAALQADPNAALDKGLTTPELQKIFDDAKKGGGAAPSKSTKPPANPDSGPSDNGGYTPPPESPVNTPLPIYVEPDASLSLSKVVLRYKPYGASEYKSIELKKTGKGWGGLIPCEDVGATGDVRFFFAFTGTDGEAAGSIGSAKAPFKTTVKSSLDGAPPSLPGKSPPEVCKLKEDCPPGLAGCPDAKGKHGDKGWGTSCDASSECKEGLSCVNGDCEEGKGTDDDSKKDSGPSTRRNLIGVGAQFDFLNLKSTNAACDGSDQSFVCFLQGTNDQFFGKPVQNYKNTDGISGGGAFAGARVLVGYDRQIVRSVPLSLGVRVGYAFGGPKAPDNANMNIGGGKVIPVQPIANGFLPFHAEGRMSFHFLGGMMEDKAFRPYVFAGGGYGQVNGSVNTDVCDQDASVYPGVPNSTSNACGALNGTNLTLRQVTTYQITGLGFADLGVGTTFGFTPVFGIEAEVKLMFMLPTFGFVASPYIGPVFNF